MVLGILPMPWRPTVWMMVGQGPIALAVGAGGELFGHFSLSFSPLSPSLWETARYRLKYCLKGTTNQPTMVKHCIYLCLISFQMKSILTPTTRYEDYFDLHVSAR